MRGRRKEEREGEGRVGVCGKHKTSLNRSYKEKPANKKQQRTME